MRSEDNASGATVVRHRVTAEDLDEAGAIAFAAHARFAENAEQRFFEGLGFSRDTLAELGVRLTRVHADFDFFRPALLEDELRFDVLVGGVGVHSVRLQIGVVRAADHGAIAEATLVSACVDGDRRSAALPDAFANALRARAGKS